MRAIVCSEWGKPDSLGLRHIAEPLPNEGGVLIDVSVCTANFADVLMVAGTYQTRPALPFTPGLEAAGRISYAPRGSGFRNGDRVVAFLWYGGYADQASAAASETFAIPPAMSFETAAALTSAYASAALAIIHVGRLGPSQTLLVRGAGGGAGSAAVEIGKAVGARVIAVASTPEKLALARDCGADLAVSYRDCDWDDQVIAYTGERGVDVCFDPVGGKLFDPTLSMLGWGGRYVLFGFASGEIPQIKANRLLVKHRAALGSSLRYFRRHESERLRDTMAQLFAWWERGQVRPRITQRLPLDRTVDGLRSIADGRAIGKIAICMDEAALTQESSSP
jgi:NADPH2:quinone reductase